MLWIDVFKMLALLTSILLFDNRSLTISMFSFSTAKNNAVLQNHIILKFHLKIWFWITSKDMILNVIEKYNLNPIKIYFWT